jgi:hypothetical protein
MNRHYWVAINSFFAGASLVQIFTATESWQVVFSTTAFLANVGAIILNLIFIRVHGVK